MTPDGSCAPQLAGVRDAFASLDDLGETGAACAVYLDGECVVDLWGGVADATTGRPWAADTLAFLFSATKPFAAFAAMVLVAEGRLELDAPVRATWPEFDGTGHGSMPVRWLLAHRAGLPAPRHPVTAEVLQDWAAYTSALAQSEPWWEPGTASGYHSGSYGHLVGELVRRASGSATFGMALRELVTGPLALDVHVGLPGGQHSRVARSAWASGDGADGPSIPPGSMAAAMAQLSSVLPDINDPRHWAEEWPSRNGLGTARALAKCYDAVGGTFFPKEVRAALAQSQGRGVDLVLSMFGVPDEVEWGLGVFRNGGQLGPGAETFGHPGAGGCTAFTDPDHRLSFAFTTNHLRDQLFGMDPRAQLLIRAVYDAL